MIWCSAGKVWPRFRDSPFLKRNIKLSRLYFKSCHINSEIICIWNLSIKPLSKSNVILTGDDSETESHYFSILFFKLLPRKLLLILIISFWGELVISRGIKRSKGHWWRNSEEVERAWNWSACHTSNSLILGILGSKARRKYFSPPPQIAGCLHIHIGIEGHRRNSLFASIYFSKWLESESEKGAARAEY